MYIIAKFLIVVIVIIRKCYKNVYELIGKVVLDSPSIPFFLHDLYKTLNALYMLYNTLYVMSTVHIVKIIRVSTHGYHDFETENPEKSAKRASRRSPSERVLGKSRCTEFSGEEK